jgi:hypothetical protein
MSSAQNSKQSNEANKDFETSQSPNNDLLTNRSESSTVPHARMIDNGRKFDLSPYCKVGLIDSVTRLTSIPWALKTILRPAGKIMWRSLYMDDANANIGALFAALSTNTPIDEVPLKRKSATASAPPGGSDLQTRSWPARIVQFVFIGIPLAILVGLVYGVCIFLQSLIKNILNVIQTVRQLYDQAREDVEYYKAHPDELPTRNKAIEAVSVQVISPYVSRMVRKVPLIGSCLASPFEQYFGQVAAKRINSVYDYVERRSKKGSS